MAKGCGLGGLLSCCACARIHGAMQLIEDLIMCDNIAAEYLACPTCGNREKDTLYWVDEDTEALKCLLCDTQYAVPESKPVKEAK